MSHLLDVNFLVALFDPRHVNHDAAHYWFRAACISDWATCSITEAGCIRVLSNPAYRTVSATPHEVLRRLARFCHAEGHSFWSDDVTLRISLADEVRDRLQGHDHAGRVGRLGVDTGRRFCEPGRQRTTGQKKVGKNERRHRGRPAMPPFLKQRRVPATPRRRRRSSRARPSAGSSGPGTGRSAACGRCRAGASSWRASRGCAPGPSRC